MKTKNIRTYGAIMLSLLFWSFSYIWAKVALTGMSVGALVSGRFVVASLVFLSLFLIKGFPHFATRDFIKLVLVAFCFPFIYYMLETTALQTITASEAGIISATLPVFVLLISRVFLKEKITLEGITGAILSFVGIYLLVLGNEGVSFTANNLRGYGFMVISMVACSSYMVILKTLSRTYSTLSVTGTQICLGTVYILIFTLLRRDGLEVTLTLPVLASALSLAFLSTMVAFFCYNYSLTKLSAPKVAIFINGVPLLTALLAWFILGERLSSLQLMGGSIIFFAVLLANGALSPTHRQTNEKSPRPPRQ